MAGIVSLQDGALVKRRRNQPMMQVTEPVPVNEVTELRESTSQQIPSLTDQLGNVPPEASSLTLEKVRVCRVETILPDRFTAIFTEPGVGDKRVRFPRGRVQRSDRHLLREGAVFYWIVGIRRESRENVGALSFIRFRRTPRLSSQQLDELEKVAEEAIRLAGGSPITDQDLLSHPSETNIPASTASTEED